MKGLVVMVLAVIEFLADIGLEWLIDGDRRTRPWASLCLGGMAALSLALIPHFHRTWEGWFLAVIAVFFGFLCYVDYTWWREERERKKRVQEQKIERLTSDDSYRS